MKIQHLKKFSNKLSLDFELKRRIRSMNEEIERSKENNDNLLKYNSNALEEGYIEKIDKIVYYFRREYISYFSY